MNRNDAMPGIAWRIVAFGLPLAAFFLVPVPDRAAPVWAVIFLALAPSRLTTLREGAAGLSDISATLPFVALAVVGLARFSPGGTLAGGFEAGAGAMLLAAVSELAPRAPGSGRWGLAIATVPLFAVMAFAWSFDRPLEIGGAELVAALVAGTAVHGGVRA